MLDTLERIRTAAGGDLGYYPMEKVLVEVYPEIESFTQVTPLSEDAISNTGTVAICQFNRILITSPRLYLQGYSWLDTISHEYIHYVLTKLSGNTIPLWLQEGIAKYMEVRWRKEEGGEMTPWSKSILKNAIKTGDIVTFEEMGNSFANLRSARRAALAFAQVETMVEYIVKKFGKDTLRNIIDKFSIFLPQEQVMSQVLNSSMEEFLKGWREYAWGIVKDAQEHLEVIHPEIKNGKTRMSETDTIGERRARDYVTLGSILEDRGRLDGAIKEYEKAVRLSPGSPFLVNKLSPLLIKKGRRREAKQLLENIAQLYPDYYQTLINLALVYKGIEEGAKLEDVLLRANAINPFDPFIHNELYLLYIKSNRHVEAQREKEVLNILGEKTE
jgi:tetratricopeptide (TPR) repeat protein